MTIKEHNMAEDMSRCDWLLEKVKDDRYAQNLYAAMCNMRWIPAEVVPILKEELWSCTWRSAGGIVAELQGKGDYLTWYCSGMGGLSDYHGTEDGNGFVPEAMVTDEIRDDLRRLGWIPVPWEDD